VRVGADISPLVQTRAGTARHVRGLVGALRGRADLELELLSFGGTGRVSSVVRDTWWYSRGIRRGAGGLDVLHCTTFRGPIAGPTPTVVTVHDLAILRHPESLPRWHRRYGRAGLAEVVRAADAVVAVSEFTKAETVELLGVPPERIRVVGNGVDPVFTAEGERADGDYVLAVGTLEPRKNVGSVVEAAAMAGVNLNIVGAQGWGGVDTVWFRMGGGESTYFGEIPDAELACLYRGARCFVYPSLYEGFGLPVVEAMACGTPVVTSRGGALEEVAGGAAVLVDPRSPEAIAAGIAEAEARRDELVPLGLARAAQFTWTRAADCVEALWRELA
jgi:glycosyltransferase involved in cell wall biosynthesis